jgi:hypothetical protein
MSVNVRAIEQLSLGNPVPYAEEKQKQLDEANVHLHSVTGIQELGQVQGRAAALKEMLEEFGKAGIRPGSR